MQQSSSTPQNLVHVLAILAVLLPVAVETSGKAAAPRVTAGARGSERAIAPADSLPVLVPQVGHFGPILQVAFSPTGETLATAGYDGSARLWNTRTGEVLAVLAGHSGPVSALSFSPDGRRLATASWDGSTRLWDARTGGAQAVLQASSGSLVALAWSPGGQMVASAGYGVVQLWNVEPRKLEGELRGPTGWIWALEFSPDGRRLVTAGDDRTVRLWDPAAPSGGPTATLSGHKDRVGSVAISRDGILLASGSRDGEVRLWEVRKARAGVALAGEMGEVTMVRFSPDGKQLAAAGADGPPRVWDVASGSTAATLGSGLEAADLLAFSPDGRSLAAGGRDGKTRLWDLSPARPRAVLPGDGSRVLSLAFAPNGARLAAAGEKGAVRLWTLGPSPSPAPRSGRSGPLSAIRRTMVLPANPLGFQSAALSRGGQSVIAAQGDGEVDLWDLGSGQLRGALPWQTRDRTTVLFTPDSGIAATRGMFLTRFWDVANLRLMCAVDTDSGDDVQPAFSPDGRFAATAGLQSTTVWDIRGGVRKTSISTGALLPRFQLRLATDGQRIAMADEGGTLRVCDIETGSELAALTGQGSIAVLALSPDGRSLAAGGQAPGGSSTVKLWDSSSLELRWTLPAGGGAIRKLVFAPGGRTLAMVSANEARLCDPTVLTPTAILLSVPEGIEDAEFTRDSTLLAIRSRPGKVTLWDASTGRPVPLGHPSASLPPGFLRSVLVSGGAVFVREPVEGRVLASFQSLPSSDSTGTTLKRAARQWIAYTPEGYLIASPGASPSIRWNLRGVLLPGQRFWDRFRRPDVLRKALRQEGARP